MKNRIRPPNTSRTLANTNRSKSPYSAFSGNGTNLPSRRRRATWRPTANALVNRPRLDAALLLLSGDDAGVGLLEDARRGAHERRFDHPGVLDDLVDATVDGAGEPARQLGGDQHLAEGVRERQPQQLQSRPRRAGPSRRSRRRCTPTPRVAAAPLWGDRWSPRCRSVSPAGRQ